VTVEATLAAALDAGTSEHYADAALYDHEYKRRRHDVAFYRELAPSPTRILELGCGSGRLLIPLARDGHKVTGVDLSASMLERCRERLDTARLTAKLVKADFRHLPVRGRFPLVVSPFNAFMHLYTRHDAEQFLDGVRRRLEPGGRFVFDVMFPDLAWLSRDPRKRWSRTRFRHPTSGRVYYYSTNLIFDAALQIAFMRIYYEPADGRGRTRVVRLTHRYHFPAELEALLHYNGFVVERHDGGFAGEPLEPGCDQQVLVCRRRK
jgi:SAM-dependent methyltransferase